MYKRVRCVHPPPLPWHCICVSITKRSECSTIIFTHPGPVSSHGACWTHHRIQGRKSSALHRYQVRRFARLSKYRFCSLTNCLVIMGKTTNFLLFCLSSAHFRGKCLSVIFRKFPMVRSRLESPVFARTGEGACIVSICGRVHNTDRPFSFETAIRIAHSCGDSSPISFSSWLSVCVRVRVDACSFSVLFLHVSWNSKYTDEVAAAAELPRPTFLWNVRYASTRIHPHNTLHAVSPC